MRQLQSFRLGYEIQPKWFKTLVKMGVIKKIETMYYLVNGDLMRLGDVLIYDGVELQLNKGVNYETRRSV